MLTSLIITTYNRPDALRVVLRSVFAQSIAPDEIVIADDGSDGRTADLLDQMRAESAIPIIHAWQEDLGFRAARVRNLATSKARGDYLIFIDGDMVLHPEFIHSHCAAAGPGYYLHGKRAMLGDSLTARVIEKGSPHISPFSPGISLRKRAWHIPLLAGVLSHDSHDWYATQSANLSVWTQDYVRVNGFNEDFEGWGREDSEFALRLSKSGLVKRELRFCAIAFHLSHGKDNKEMYADQTARNELLLQSNTASGQIRCTNGFAQHIGQKDITAS